MFDFEIITTQQQLASFVEKINACHWLAIDTEFLREKNYYAQLCLIQVEADNGARACIDPLSIEDLSEFSTLLHNERITKVLHAAHQDLELLLQLTGQVPAPIFDTQTAASVLGIGEQMGYARLVEALLDVHLAKTQSRTDWSKRPLRDAQLEYAIDDVRYLAQLYPKIRAQLESQQRLNWLTKDFARMTDPQTYAINARERWKKVRGQHVLKRPQLAVLRELAAWREERAEQSDRPRKWIMSDEILIDLARMQPSNSAAFAEIRGLNAERTQKYHDTWLSLIKKAQQLPEEEWPQITRSKKPSANQNALTDLLMLVIQLQAKHHNISAAAITTRKRVAEMVINKETVLSDDWRGALVNDQLAAVLNGTLSIGTINGVVELVEQSA